MAGRRRGELALRLARVALRPRLRAPYRTRHQRRVRHARSRERPRRGGVRGTRLRCYGSAVVVDHGRDVKTLYGHLSGIYVHEGQRVARATVLGAVGNTGRATLGVPPPLRGARRERPVDPMLYVQGNRPERSRSPDRPL